MVPTISNQISIFWDTVLILCGVACNNKKVPRGFNSTDMYDPITEYINYNPFNVNLCFRHQLELVSFFEKLKTQQE